MIVLASLTDTAQGIVETFGIDWPMLIAQAINFLIVAWVLFIVIKGINSMKKAEEAAAPAGPTKDQELLMEIRDSLKKRK